MDAHKEISDWLANPKRDYATGAILYTKYGKNKSLARLLTMKSGIASYQDKMKYELGKLIDTGQLKQKPKPKSRKKAVKPSKAKPQPPTVEEIEKAVKQPKSTFTAKEFESLPEGVKALEKEWKRLYKERGHLKAVKKHLPTQQERKECAFTILEIGQTIDQIFNDIAYYKKHGFLPDRESLEKDVPGTLHEVEKALNQCRVRISKLKKKKDKESKADLKKEEQLKELLLQKRTELQSNE